MDDYLKESSNVHHSQYKSCCCLQKILLTFTTYVQNIKWRHLDLQSDWIEKTWRSNNIQHGICVDLEKLLENLVSLAESVSWKEVEPIRRIYLENLVPLLAESVM
jgi:hypothetical protein